MKRQLTAVVLLLCAFAAGAQQAADSGAVSDDDLDPRTGFPKITEKPFVMFDEGPSFALVTRITKQEKRSNFVWQDYLIGAHVAMMTENIKPFDLMLRVTAFYPFYHTFNGMEQYPKQTILYAFDLFSGPVIQANMWNYVRINLSAGLHYMYQLTDEYHLHYLGLGAFVGLELPVAWHWTALLDGTAALDYPNLGTNSTISPYDYAWQYHVSFGVRYSKKGANQHSYINSKKRARLMAQRQQMLREIYEEEARWKAAADSDDRGQADADTADDAPPDGSLTDDTLQDDTGTDDTVQEQPPADHGAGLSPELAL